jgi:hypothetical protein
MGRLELSFRDFSQQAPEFAAAARRMLTEDGGPSVAFLGTVARDGRPRLAPFSPIFSGDDLFVSAGSRTPKRYDLVNDGRYVLHAMLGENDEELQLAGRGELVADAAARASVHADISFQFDAEDPIFRLAIERSLWGHWEKVGQPGTYPVRRRWKLGEGESAA